MVRALHCFHPDTKLTLEDGTLCEMKNLALGAKLKNGARVQSVMRLTNLNEDGSQMEEIFEMAGEAGTPIYVSGSHLVYDLGTDKFVSVKQFAHLCDARREPAVCRPSDVKCDELSCLITSDHTIPIGDFFFHDWEDNNGSPSKTLGKQ